MVSRQLRLWFHVPCAMCPHRCVFDPLLPAGSSENSARSTPQSSLRVVEEEVVQEEVHVDLPGELPPLDVTVEFSAVSSAMGTVGDEGSIGSRTPLREDEFHGFELPPAPDK